MWRESSALRRRWRAGVAKLGLVAVWDAHYSRIAGGAACLDERGVADLPIVGATWVEENGLWHLNYDGSNDYCGLEYDLDTADKDFAVGAWFRLASTAVTYDTIISWKNASAKGWVILYRSSANGLHFQHVNTSGAAQGVDIAWSPDTDWHYLFLGVDRANEFHVFLDGDFSASYSIWVTGSLSDSSQWVQIGASDGSSHSAPWGGDIGLCHYHDFGVGGLPSQTELEGMAHQSYEATKGMYDA